MARTAKYVKLDTKTARTKLASRKEPYYTQIATGLCLGYVRRATGPGGWVRREKVAGIYRYRTLGAADDVAQADGRDVLTFDQALKTAGAAVVPTSAKLTIKTAVDRYLTALAARSAHSTEARQRAEKHIVPDLGDYRVDRVTKNVIESWLAGLVRDDDPEHPDAKRRSQDSANRVLTILKAALNAAFADEANGIPTDSAWRRVKAFRNVAGARSDHFEAVTIRTLITKARTFDKRFADLCEAGYLTGARLGELVSLDVHDFDAPRGLLLVRKGKTGARAVSLSAEGVAFFKKLAANRPAAAILLPKSDGNRWGKSEQARPFKRAAELAELPKSASFYSLRHSYISRAIEAGMPLSLLAENCGTSLTMIERNYAHVLAATRRDVIEKTAPKLRRVK
jgi:integrase